MVEPFQAANFITRRNFSAHALLLLIAVATCAAVETARAASAPSTQPVLSGRIVDQKGNPVPNATVTLNGSAGSAATTDADGRYSFATIRRDGEYRIGVEAVGFMAIPPWIDNQAGIQLSTKTHAQRNLTLERGATIHVTVTDLLGAPVPDADVDVCLNDHEDRGRSHQRKLTNPGGIAIFTVARSSNAYCVAATMNDHEPVHEIVTVDALEKPKDVDLQLLPGTPIKGLAICSDGKPAAGWTLSAAPPWWMANYIPRQATIDKDGNFTLSEVGPGMYDLMLWKRNRGSSVGVFHFPPASQPLRLDFPFPSPASLATLNGKVHVTGGRPDYVTVQANGPDTGYNSAQISFSGLSRPRTATQVSGYDGTFTLPDLTPGVYQLRFDSPQLESRTIENVKIPGDLPTVELKVVAKPHLHGAVVDAASGQPIKQYAVRAKKIESLGNGPNYGQEERWIQVSDPQGDFDIEVVGPGIYKAQINADGYAWALSDNARLEPDGKATPLQVKMTPGGSLSGRVTNPSGALVAGAKIIPLSMTRADGPGEEPGFSGDAGAVLSDAMGHFTLSHLAAGEESIKVIADRFAPQVMNGLQINESGAADAGTIKLLIGGTVEGTVYDDHGKPSAGVSLQFNDNFPYYDPSQRNGKSLGTFTTNANGHFHVEHLPQDVIYVNVVDGWQRQGVGRRTVRPVDGKTTQLDLGGTTPVTGRLLVGGKPANAARVELAVHSEHFGPIMVYTTTSSDGRFTFYGPPAGPYTFFYMLPGEWSNLGRLNDVTITDQPRDLGDLSVDVGRVNVTVQADDPADLAQLKYGAVGVDSNDILSINNMIPLRRDGTDAAHWTATNVATGRKRATIHAGSIAYSTVFERAAGTAETTVTIHVPRASARLSLKYPGATKGDERNGRYFQLRNADSTVVVYMGPNKQDPKFATLPPGTYSPMSEFNRMPTPAIPPIELKAGDEKTIDVPPLTASEQAMRPLEIQPWTSDGLPVMEAKVQLMDAQGKAIESARSGELNSVYTVSPGHYRTSIERPGVAAFANEIDVPAASDPNNARTLKIHVTLP